MIVRRQIRQLEQEIQSLQEKIKTVEARFGYGHEDVVSDYRKMLVERKALLQKLKNHKESA